jgi:hypothetical protein
MEQGVYLVALLLDETFLEAMEDGSPTSTHDRRACNGCGGLYHITTVFWLMGCYGGKNWGRKFQESFSVITQ